MAKFRKKPVEIEARQHDGTAETGNRIIDWIGKDHAQWAGGIGPAIAIHTLEGTMTADVNDWVIQGVKGEFYPCKPDIFAATYEPVE